VVAAATTTWGIHDTDGQSIFNEGQGPTSYVDLSDRNMGSIPDYPVGSGGFQSYNKVQKPGELTLTLSKEGTDSARQTFRRVLEDLRQSVSTVNVLTPSWVYKGYNLLDLAVQRNAEKGSNMLTVRLSFKAVRNSVGTTFSKVQDPSAASSINSGAVQTRTPSNSQTPGALPQ